MGQFGRMGAALLVLLVPACASYDYSEQSGGYFETRNSPLPVPRPRNKPKVPYRSDELVVAKQQTPSVKRSGGQSLSVKTGDTVYGLARRYNIPVKDLIKHNRLRPPYVLSVGQRLTIPSQNHYVVRRGDTSYSIAMRYGVQISALMRLNNIRKPYILSVGQKLQLPGGAEEAPTRLASNSNGNAPKTTTRPSRKPTERKKNLAAPPRTGSGFTWPVEGRIVSRFGPKQGGQKNEGINIAVKQGTPVRAAQSGVVVYANNGIEGYGNLLLVKHSGGWMTAYAHNERILVSEGQKVKRGQIIARVGKSGGVKVPQLHFEIRKGRLTYDPLKYLRK